MQYARDNCRDILRKALLEPCRYRSRQRHLLVLDSDLYVGGIDVLIVSEPLTDLLQDPLVGTPIVAGTAPAMPPLPGATILETDGPGQVRVEVLCCMEELAPGLAILLPAVPTAAVVSGSTISRLAITIGLLSWAWHFTV